MTLEIFGAQHENLNEDRRVLSAAKMRRNNPMYSLWHYKVYADILDCCLETRRQTTVSGVIENFDFQGFRTLCLRHLSK